MRALLVTAFAAGLLAAGAAPPVALHAGDRVTDRDIFAYLSLPVHPGDWVRYHVTFASGAAASKTIGFGSEPVAGAPTLFIETHVRAQAVSGLPAGSTVGVGTEAVLKTYVEGRSFGDLETPYRVITSAVKVGDFEYEVAPVAQQTYSALAGDAIGALRRGSVDAVEPVDLQVGGQTVHATHVVASFPAAPLPAAGISTALRMEVWQSPDVVTGTVAISSVGWRPVRWRMTDFGRGGYRSLFRNSLDAIRAQTKPAMP